MLMIRYVCPEGQWQTLGIMTRYWRILKEDTRADSRVLRLFYMGAPLRAMSEGRYERDEESNNLPTSDSQGAGAPKATL